jgi:sugar phosphate isomerase/epimerase
LRFGVAPAARAIFGFMGRQVLRCTDRLARLTLGRRFERVVKALAFRPRTNAKTTSKLGQVKTRTGGFEIGFRRGGSEWQKNPDSLLDWAKVNDLNIVDIGTEAPDQQAAFASAGVKIGTVDLPNGRLIFSDDLGKRDAAMDETTAFVETCAAFGVDKFFTVLVPEHKEKPRRENFATIVAALQMLVPTLEKHNACIVIEGWPGPGALACTPEGYRAVFREIPSNSMAVNYDPSHLIRMGIDPIRFLEEFADRVRHVHGKDTELLAEGLYEYGHEQDPTFGKQRHYGGMSWRYTIPGHGVFRWTKGFEILAARGYTGAVCIELEDEYFNTDEAGEKQGILAGATFLTSC